jgi:hypothetical protein
MSYEDFMRLNTEKDFSTKQVPNIGMPEDFEDEIIEKHNYLCDYLFQIKEYYKTHKLHTPMERREYGKTLTRTVYNDFRKMTQDKQHKLMREIQSVEKEVKRLNQHINIQP